MSLEKPAVVSTKSGKLEGYFEKGLYIFKGIPFARPPVGNLRWMPPQPVKKWDGVRAAKQFGPIFPQILMPVAIPGAPSFAEQEQSEDALYLNIWTPGLDDARRPVLFWIHGGAFIIGSGSEAFLDAGTLSRRGDVVLVSINYRLGSLGFMNLAEVTSGKIPATGNEGLLDQAMALDWVIENISAFGGDPKNITVSGFSAGAMSTGDFLSMPLVKGKFQKAMNRSGSGNVVGTVEDAVKVAGKYLEALKVNGKDSDALRKMTVKQLMDAQNRVQMIYQTTEHRATPFQPVLDGKVLPEWPLAAIKKGSAKNIPVMAGTSLQEFKATVVMNPGYQGLDEASLLKRAKELIPGDIATGIISDYQSIMGKRGEGTSPVEVLGMIITDIMFRMPTIKLIEAQRDNGAPAYNYLFTHKSPALNGILGAMHGLDNPFLFGCLDKDFSGDGPEEQALAIKMQDSTIAFMKTGDPSCTSLGRWPVYGKERMTMLLDKQCKVEAAPYEAERRAWDSYHALYTPPV